MAKPPKPQSPAAAIGAADYTVGYGKPPAASQFKTGQSGNPRGGSKRVRARKADENSSPFDRIILKESKRKVVIIENGVRSEITAMEAALRKLAIAAATGERSAQKQYFDQVQAAHERQQKDKMARFGLLAQYVNEQAAARAGASITGMATIWPHPDDVRLDYGDCTGEVVGPIDTQQSEPFIALVGDYRVWQARLVRLQTMASQSAGEQQDLYDRAMHAVTGLISVICHHLPPSFKAQLDWDESDNPVGALDIEDLGGGIVTLALLAPQGEETAHGLDLIVTNAQSALAKVRDRARLDITANTTSLVNRLQIERQNRAAGMAPAPAVPDFAQFYGSIATEGHGTADEVEP